MQKKSACAYKFSLSMKFDEKEEKKDERKKCKRWKDYWLAREEKCKHSTLNRNQTNSDGKQNNREERRLE